MSNQTCDVCEEPFPDAYTKYDPKAPVIGDDMAYHLGCEDEVYEEVHCRV